LAGRLLDPAEPVAEAFVWLVVGGAGLGGIIPGGGVVTWNVFPMGGAGLGGIIPGGGVVTAGVGTETATGLTEPGLPLGVTVEEGMMWWWAACRASLTACLAECPWWCPATTAAFSADLACGLDTTAATLASATTAAEVADRTIRSSRYSVSMMICRRVRRSLRSVVNIAGLP